MINKEIIYEKVLKYLSILKKGKTITTAPLLLDLKRNYGKSKLFIIRRKG